MAKFMKRRGQIAFEYIVLIGFMLTITSMTTYYFGLKIGEISEDNQRQTFDKVKDIMFYQLNYAVAAQDGYETTFYMPAEVDGYAYDFRIDDDVMFVLEFDRQEYVYKMPNSSIGNFCYSSGHYDKYPVIIRNEDGIASASNCFNCTIDYKTCVVNENNQERCPSLSVSEVNQCKQYCRCMG